MSALHAADGAFLLGLMAPHTANAGQLYFPTGTPDPDDVRGDTVDFDGSLLRELAEETGLTADDVGGCSGMARRARRPAHGADQAPAGRASPRPRCARASSLISRARREPELCDIVIVRSRADLDARMPEFVTAFLIDFWSRHAS